MCFLFRDDLLVWKRWLPSGCSTIGLLIAAQSSTAVCMNRATPGFTRFNSPINLHMSSYGPRLRLCSAGRRLGKKAPAKSCSPGRRMVDTCLPISTRLGISCNGASCADQDCPKKTRQANRTHTCLQFCSVPSRVLSTSLQPLAPSVPAIRRHGS